MDELKIQHVYADGPLRKHVRGSGGSAGILPAC